MDNNYKTIHFHVWDANGLFAKRGDHVEYQTVQCNASDRCGFHKQGKCKAIGFMCSCPHALFSRQIGPTRRASYCHKFLSTAKERFKGVPCLDIANGESVEIVGDYVYVPLSHLQNYVNPIKIEGMKGDHFIPRDKLTAELIVTLANFKPEALFGGVIGSYQEECVPKFLRGIREKFPELMEAAIKLDPKLSDRFGKTTNVGRKALLHTLKPNVGFFKDIHGGKWTWDGEYLTSFNSHAGFVLTSFSEIRIKPLANQSVTVTDDGQVTDKTEFCV